MSTWFKSFVYYGVKLEYDKFKELKGDFDWTEEEVSMFNSPDEIGWEADGMNGDWAIFGKLILEGTDNGNDDPLGGDGEIVRLPLLSGDDKLAIDQRIKAELGSEYANQADYYVVGQYS